VRKLKYRRGKPTGSQLGNRWTAIAHLILLLFAAAPAHAQDTSHWGISGSVVPRWEFLDFLEDSSDKSIEMRGDDLRVGIVRGRQLGGEWGAAFIRRRIAEGSTVLQEHPKCLARPGQPDLCAGGTFHRTQNASMTGIQFHRFFPVGTIARRVQIGAVVSGGVARIRGQAEEVQEHLQISVSSATGATSLSVASESATVDARELFEYTFATEYMPIGGAEAALAVLVAPGVKVRVSGGVNFPAFHRIAITAQYLFGAQ
jgi:hypothetical protein